MNKVFKYAIITCFVVFIAGCNLNKNKLNPLEATDKVIPDGEKLVYAVENDKGLLYHFTEVIKISNKTAAVFAHFHKDGSGLKMPSNYSNYQTHMIISLEKGSLLTYYDDNRTNAVLDDTGEPAETEIDIDQSGGTAVCIEKIWNGYEFTVRKSRIKITPGYPVWNWNFIMFMGIRFLNTSKQGIIYLIVPQYIKTAFFGSFINKGKERLTTKAGNFNTVKLGFSLGDPFLSRLTDKYVKDFCFWVDEQSGILIKETGFETSVILVEKGNV